MTETNKTLTFLALAAATCVAAFFSQPGSAKINVNKQVGKQLTKEFAAEDARRMKITGFDEDAATLDTFEVAQVGRLWSIPSKDGYPADAQEQMAKAVDGVRGREILRVASQTAEAHEQYGVLDPTSPDLSPGDTGVGARVTLEDASGDALVDLIIGETVKDSDGLHYVRRADQDIVYEVQIDPQDFSTTFEDWIEDDLLKISPWDISQVKINDYSAEMVPTGGGLAIDPHYRTDLTLRYDDGESKWEAVKLQEATDPKSGKYKEFTLADDEELNDETLSELKSALDDLRIVDIAKKPTGLSADLKAGDELRKDFETMLSLVNRGFAPMESGEMISTSGEVICTMKDGVEYVLRFGDPQVTPTGKEPNSDAKETRQGLNRYMFVMARVNEDALEKPELQEVPELSAGVTDELADTEEASNEDTDSDAAEKEESANDETAEEAVGESEEAEGETDEPSTEELIAQRKEIEQGNQRKLDEYADKLTQAKQKVAELNERFGDWYYVVPGEEFSKIQLGRADVIKKKDPAQGEEKQAEAGPLGAADGSVPGLPNFSDISPAQAPTQEEPVEEKPTEGSADTVEDAAETDKAEEPAE